MATITLRVDDGFRRDIEVVARARGESTSDLIRTAIEVFLGKEDDEARPTGGPQSLTLVERAMLTSHHEQLASLYEDEDWEHEHHKKVVEVLESGFTGEYDIVFSGLDPEIPRRECKLLWKILDMFKFLQFSLAQLDDAAKAEIGKNAEDALSFRGFDGNDSRESALLRYAAFLVNNDRWIEHKAVFEHDGGNSHSPMLGSYERMLAEFEPIWDRKTRDYSTGGPSRYLLNVEELKVIYAAWPHPDSPAGRRASGD